MWCLDESSLTISGGGLTGKYKAAQFHFHWGSDSSKGSEHKLDGKTYPLEVSTLAEIEYVPF